jgi:hypothetical protein
VIFLRLGGCGCRWRRKIRLGPWSAVIFLRVGAYGCRWRRKIRLGALVSGDLPARGWVWLPLAQEDPLRGGAGSGHDA